MARSVPDRSPSARSTGSRLTNRPSRKGAANTRAVSRPQAKKAMRVELIRRAEQMLAKTRERPASDRPAIRYLESSRGLGPPTAPLSPADQAKISYAQADLVVHVITTVLDGLGLSNEVWGQGCDIAMRELKAASEEGWSPL